MCQKSILMLIFDAKIQLKRYYSDEKFKRIVETKNIPNIDVGCV